MNHLDRTFIAGIASRLVRGECQPDFVLVNAAGECLPPLQALADRHILSDVVLIRADGSTLGFPSAFAPTACLLGADKCVVAVNLGRLRLPAPQTIP